MTSTLEGYTKIQGRVKRSIRRHGLWSYLVEEDGKETWYPHGTVIELPPNEVLIKTEEYKKKKK